MPLFADAQLGIYQIILQAGAFGLLAILLIRGCPMFIRMLKDHDEQIIAIFNSNQETYRTMASDIASGMRAISQEMAQIANTMTSFNNRLEQIEYYLDERNPSRKS